MDFFLFKYFLLKKKKENLKQLYFKHLNLKRAREKERERDLKLSFLIGNSGHQSTKNNWL